MNNAGISPKTVNWAMLPLLLIATWLRLFNLGAQNIAFDESFSLSVTRLDWVTMFGALLSDGVHPPLFYIIHKLILNLAGTTEFGQRFLVAVFSILAVPLIFRLGKALFTPLTGLVAALLMAINPVHVWLAQEARMYSLLLALTVASMTFFWCAVQHRRRKFWIALSITNSLIFLTHYFGFLVPTIQFAFLLFTFRRNFQALRPWFLAQIVAVLPIIPWLIATALRDAQTFGIGFLLQPSILDLWITYWNLIVGYSPAWLPITLLALLMMLAPIVLAWRKLPPHWIKHKHARLLISVWAILPPFMVWMVSQRRSFYADRYFLFVVPGLLLLIAYGVSRVASRQWRYALIGMLVVASSVGLMATHLDDAFKKDDWRGLAAYISAQAAPNDVVLLYSTHIKFAIDYYLQEDAVTVPISLNLQQFPIEPLVNGHQRVWVIYPYTRRPTHYPAQPLLPQGYWADDPDRNSGLVAWLGQHHSRIVDYQHFRGIELWLVDLQPTHNIIQNQ